MNRKMLAIMIFFTSMLILIMNIYLNTRAENTEEEREEEWILPAESLTFIEEENFIANRTVLYEWYSDEAVRGAVVLEETFQHMLTIPEEERAAFFETLDYIEGKSDFGRIISSSSGKIYFVFLNLNDQEQTLRIVYRYLASDLPGWLIGLIAAVVIIALLALGVLVIYKLRKPKADETEELTPEQRYMQF